MKSITKLLLLAVITMITIVGNVHAQPPTSMTPADSTGTIGEDFYRNTYFAIGASLSRLSGTGLSGRMSLPGGMTVQTTFFLMTIGKYFHFNIGGEVQYAFVRNKSGRLYAMLGLGYYSSTFKDETTGKTEEAIADPFAIGLGFGYEFFVSAPVVVSLAAPITYFPETGKVFPLPQIGFYYYFR
jgi:hypothetical protein